MKRMNKTNKPTANYLYMGIPPSEQVSDGSFLISIIRQIPTNASTIFISKNSVKFFTVPGVLVYTEWYKEDLYRVHPKEGK